ncbi:aspartate/glutamate racemase family protein [Olivibacter sp. SDN3]|uniref:aspartate/glutamate racemase family protein n=1 Tax=Olivibacter sp. SDN3 TaxID=2764720 RepID=UPI001650EA28|nr:aspartate/glutamate racemase family protein [Olivibacter sp. SDN3]QNL51795.1 aspartate/glutamate racemase family protein [Olivibacter sp. SDN3]
MKNKTLGLVHTSATLVPVFQQLCQEHLPDVSVFNMVDDSLIKDVIAKGELTPATAKRVVNQITSAEQAGADFILVTCSSIGKAVETADTLSNVPVIRVDLAMANEAVKIGKRIGIIATLPTTLEPTADLVLRRAALADTDITLICRLCEGAFEALMSGDSERHNKMVSSALKELNHEVDVILLAQASMAKVVDTLPEEDKKVPILSSPAMAIKYLATTIY